MTTGNINFNEPRKICILLNPLVSNAPTPILSVIGILFKDPIYNVKNEFIPILNKAPEIIIKNFSQPK